MGGRLDAPPERRLAGQGPAVTPAHRQRRGARRADPGPHRIRRIRLICAWRLTPSRHPPFDGEGARLFGGRWNSSGVPAAYPLSLAVLEALVHQGRENFPDDLLAYEVEVPDDTIETLAHVPEAWFAAPLFRQTRRFGDAWASERRSLALRVPSAVIPTEYNLLLNPRHPEVDRMVELGGRTFRFDPRLGE